MRSGCKAVKDGTPSSGIKVRDTGLANPHTFEKTSRQAAVESGDGPAILVSAATPEQDPSGAATILSRLALCNNVLSGVANPPTPDVPADRSHAESEPSQGFSLTIIQSRPCECGSSIPSIL
jgi:hypothetical protein